MIEVWRIWVSGYGEFEFDGTEAEAENMRRHKGQWERGTAYKWRADLSRPSDRLTAQIVGAFKRGEGVQQSLLKKRKLALQSEAKA